MTNDSAPLHLASAMNTPTVAIFGPTVPEFGFGPLRRARVGRRARRRWPAGRAIGTVRSAVRSDIGAACASLRRSDVGERCALTPSHLQDVLTHDQRRNGSSTSSASTSAARTSSPARCRRTASSSSRCARSRRAPSSARKAWPSGSSALIEGVIARHDRARRTRARTDFIGVGIGAPGPLDREKGIVHRRAESRLEELSAARPDRRATAICRRRSTTTRTARRSANGGRARRAAARTSSA